MAEEPMHEELEAMRKALVIRNYAEKTVSCYVSVLRRYLVQLDKPLAEVGPADIQAWQYQLVGRGVSWTLFNQMVCALRFYFSKVRDSTWPVNHIPFQRQRRKLPSILSREEVARLIDASKRNPKYYAICALLYSTGLRLGELVRLCVTDIDSKNMVIHVRQGKGGKDRQVQLTLQLLEILRDYWRSCAVKSYTWLFPGIKPGMYLSTNAVQRIVTQITKEAGIDKRVTPHTLRHCFATHLLESRTDLRTIQALLGHSNIQTTELYLHVAAHHLQTVANPLDNLPVLAASGWVKT
jgi:site-specific recombinase XerD